MPDYFTALLRGLDDSTTIESGALSNRPTPRVPGALYKVTDTDPPETYICDGDAWIELKVVVSILEAGVMQVSGADDSLDGVFPGWGASNSVSVAGGLGQMVTATFDIAADTDSLARIRGQVTDSDGTMQTVVEEAVPAGVITTALTVTTSFLVPAGRSYQFLRSGNSGVTEENQSYSTIDIGV